MISDKPRPPLRLLPRLILGIDSAVVLLVKLLDAGTEAWNGGSRDDGGSTPALGEKKDHLAA